MLVIHTQGNGAAEAMRNLLVKHNLQNKRIHHHCFTGDHTEALAWRESIRPNLKFGITSKLLTSQSLQESVQIIPTTQLLLEMDAPYLPPNGHGKDNHPWNIAKHACILANLKNIPPTLFFKIVYQNTISLYQLDNLII